MTSIVPQSAKCKDCGHEMAIKFMLTSFNSRTSLPPTMDLSGKCNACGSENLSWYEFGKLPKQRKK